MTSLTLLARLVFRKVSQIRAHIVIALVVVALIGVHPLLVNAKSIPPIGSIHNQSQLAKAAAQNTAPPQEEPTQEPTEESAGEPVEEATEAPTGAPTEESAEEPIVEPTAEPTEGPAATASAEQSNIVTSTAIVIPAIIPTSTNAISMTALVLPAVWQGEEAITAEDLAKISPPLQTETLQGQFQIAYVPAASGVTGEGVLRILPLPTDSGVGTVRIMLRLDPNSTLIPFPAGQILLAQLTARVYAPNAATSLAIADDQGSSSVAIEGLNWDDYQVARQIAADAATVDVTLEWRNVPANAWMELRDFKIMEAPAEEAVEISPTDTPTTGETVVITPTTTRTPTATAPASVANIAMPTATPVPVEISGTDVFSVTPTLVVVTSTPTPVDVLEEATRVAQATDWARILGPATPTPLNMATPTPTITPIVVTDTPIPANQATAEQMAILATAIAFTTGTPTPIPDGAIFATATDVPARPTATPRPSATATPVFILLDDIPTVQPTLTPNVPAVLMGKIVFLTSYRGNPRAPNAMVINPDGSGAGLLTTNYFYTILANRDVYSADMRFNAFSLREGGGAAYNAGLTQIFYADSLYDTTGAPHQLTYFGDGTAWAPSWSPTDQVVAYVSNESGNDEIYVSRLNQWPATQLTKNTWEWDHHPSFSPDGSEIVFDSNRGGGHRQLWLMSSNGENQRQLTNFTFEAWDAVWVKYTSTEIVTDIASDSTVDP